MTDKEVLQQLKKRKNNATKRGIDFNLTVAELRNILSAQRCSYLNTPLNVRRDYLKGITGLTLDRIDNSKGYIHGNVCASSNIANQLKNLYESGLITPDDIINFGKKLKKIN